MKKDLFSFLSDSVVYVGINILNKAIPFLLLPFIVNTISVADYGIYSLFVTTELLLIPMVGFSMHGAVNRHFFEQEHIDFEKYVSSVVKLQLFVTFSLAILYFVTTIGQVEVFGLDRNTLNIAILSAGSSAVINVLTTIFRAERKPIHYGVFILLQSLILFGSILIAIQLNPTSDGVIWGRVVVYFGFAILALILLKQRNYFSILSWSKALLKKALNFALPTIPHALAAFVFIYSDRYLIKYFLGDEAVGFYAGIFQVSALISVLAMSFNAAWVPWIFERLKANTEGVKLFIVKLSYSIKIAFVLAGIVFFFVFPFISQLFLTPEFQQWNFLSLFFIIGFVFQALYMVVGPYVFYVEKTKYLSYLSLTAAIINIVLNVILINKMGLKGAALSTCIAWGFLYFSNFYLVTRLYKMPWLLQEK